MDVQLHDDRKVSLAGDLLKANCVSGVRRRIRRWRSTQSGQFRRHSPDRHLHPGPGMNDLRHSCIGILKCLGWCLMPHDFGVLNKANRTRPVTIQFRCCGVSIAVSNMIRSLANVGEQRWESNSMRLDIRILRYTEHKDSVGEKCYWIRTY
jgi:hypothetical protein